MLVYNKTTGRIIGEIPDHEDPYIVFRNYLEVIDGNIETLTSYNLTGKLSEHAVIDGELVRLSDTEIQEMKRYGRILTEEERLEHRLLESLVPSQEEIEQAKLMIKLLPILKEVMSNE